MKKLIIALSIFLIIFISILSNSVAIETQINKTESNQTWIVDNEGDGDFRSIQKAVNNANSGDTIEVYSGIYYEDITIDKKLVLKGMSSEFDAGDDSGAPILNGLYKKNVVVIKTDGCTFTGFKVINSAMKLRTGIGISVLSDNCKISGNIIEKTFVGIGMAGRKNCIVTNNEILYNVFGINCGASLYCTLSNNSFFNSGLIIGSTANNVLTNIVKNNTINNKPYYLYVQLNDTTISNPQAGQVVLIDCHNLTIENLNISNTTIGLTVQYCSDITIRNSTFTNIHRGGISLFGDDCEIYGNTFENCSYGCYLEGGDNFYLHHNNFIKVFKHDQPALSWKKKHQSFMESTNIKYDQNYWDDWIGLKFPSLQSMPKIIPGFRTYFHKWLNIFPIFEFDLNPALNPY